MSTESILVKLTKSKPQSEDETRLKFLRRLWLACDELSEAKFNLLPEEAQDWINDGTDAYNKQKPIPEFKKEKPIEKKTKKVEASKKTSTNPAEETPRGGMVGETVRTILIKHKTLKMPVEKLNELVNKRIGTMVTFQTVRAAFVHFRAGYRSLDKAGLITPSKRLET